MEQQKIFFLKLINILAKNVGEISHDTALQLIELYLIENDGYLTRED
jgi:hypothetical protein